MCGPGGPAKERGWVSHRDEVVVPAKGPAAELLSHPLSWSAEESRGHGDSARSWIFQKGSLDGPAGSSPMFPGHEDRSTALPLSLRLKSPNSHAVLATLRTN